MKTRIPPILSTFALVCFALVQNTQAVSPAPDGGYPGNNTAEGTHALQSLTGGADNTALGFQALFQNTTGSSNMATGVTALSLNTFGSGNTATGGVRSISTPSATTTRPLVFTLFSSTAGAAATRPLVLLHYH